MDVQKFSRLRPFLYHLTDRKNLNNIIETKKLFSTKKIVENSNISNKREFLRTKRKGHRAVCSNGINYNIRDQQPISMIALPKCLSDGWNPGDFIEHLNKRVYFWCTLERLKRHFNRYLDEKPVILKFLTSEIIELNKDNVEYCRINSGATRANSYLGGIAPMRGAKTFLKGDLYPLTPGSVVEVTVCFECILPENYYLTEYPGGPWKAYKI